MKNNAERIKALQEAKNCIILIANKKEITYTDKELLLEVLEDLLDIEWDIRYYAPEFEA